MRYAVVDSIENGVIRLIFEDQSHEIIKNDLPFAAYEGMHLSIDGKTIKHEKQRELEAVQTMSARLENLFGKEE